MPSIHSMAVIGYNYTPKTNTPQWLSPDKWMADTDTYSRES